MSSTSSRDRALLLTAVPALLLAASMAWGQDPYRLKPGARGKKCLECHVTFEETMALPHVHTPVEAGNCSDCHDPHSSSHAMLLADDANQICAQCHADTVPEGAMSVHEAVLGGNCVTCHDPHAAEHPNNLLEAANELCGTCHDDVAGKARSSRFKHSPVTDSCMTCHDPHASTEARFLLTSAVPELCESCHDSTATSFVSQHMGYPVEDADCSSCHDPHGSDNGAILWANVHAPISNKMCAQCHNEPTSPDALATKNDRIDLCRGCHSRMVNESLAKNRLHGPMVAGAACLSCHAPHASAEPALLSDATLPLCGSCHESTILRQEMSLTKHEPIASGDCSSCHAPHSSNSEFLMAEDSVTEVCSMCHDWESHSSHPIGPEIKDPRNENLSLDCLSCHRTHGSEHKAFTHYEPRKGLCLECHDEFR